MATLKPVKTPQKPTTYYATADGWISQQHFGKGDAVMLLPVQAESYLLEGVLTTEAPSPRAKEPTATPAAKV